MERKHNTKLTSVAKRLRKDMTKEERHLWYDFLRSYPVRILRQKVIDDYIVDFYCHEARLVIELDGSQHFQDQNIEKDSERTRQIESHNLLVLRIPNNEVMNNFSGVCQFIDYHVNQRLCNKGPLA